jgi:hypothetical protein
MARLRKAVGRTQLDTYINLLEWLRDHGYADSNGAARKIIMERRVRSESHVLGIGKEPRMTPEGRIDLVEVVHPVVPAEVRPTLHVLKEAPNEAV